MKRKSTQAIGLVLAVVCFVQTANGQTHANGLTASATTVSTKAQLPADVAINREAGRGGDLIVALRLASGEELLFVMDTGAPGTLLDKSLEPKLGTRLGTATIRSFRGKQKAEVYVEPKLFLEGTPLLTGSNLLTCDFKQLMPHSTPAIRGILGMDCLRHYCLQLDFAAGKLRFLDSDHLNTAALGRAFPLKFSENPEAADAEIKPFIQHAGLLGGTAAYSVIDTGNNEDGMVEASTIRQHAAGSYSGGCLKRVKHFLAVQGVVKRDVGSLKCVWDGNTYTNLAVGRAPDDAPSWIGLRFLARHLVTLDFPNRIMYLKQTSVGPLK